MPEFEKARRAQAQEKELASREAEILEEVEQAAQYRVLGTIPSEANPHATGLVFEKGKVVDVPVTSDHFEKCCGLAYQGVFEAVDADAKAGVAAAEAAAINLAERRRARRLGLHLPPNLAAQMGNKKPVPEAAKAAKEARGAEK